MTDINEECRCFYILDARSVVGNCAIWWRPNAQGYTSNLDDAGLYTEAEARSYSCRFSIWPWPVTVTGVARKAVVAHVRIGHLRDAGALAEYDEGRGFASVIQDPKFATGSLRHEEHEFVEEEP